MFTLVLSLLVLVALGSLALIRALRTAPVGFEDETGFHLEEAQPVVESKTENFPAAAAAAVAA